MRHSASTRPAAVVMTLAAALTLILTGCTGTPPAPTQGAATPAPRPSQAPKSSPVAVRTPRPTDFDPYAGIALEEVPDADEIKIAPAIRIGDVGYVAASAKDIWVATSGGLVRIRPKNLTFEKIDEVGRFGIAANAAGVWVTAFEDGTVDRLDPATGKASSSTSLPGNPNGVAVFGQTVWVAEHRGGAIAAIDAASGKFLAEVSVGNLGAAGPQGVAADADGVWVGIPNTMSVARVDPKSREVVAQIAVGVSPCGGIALRADAVWVSSCFDDRFAIRIDPRTNEVAAQVDLGGHNGGAVLVDGYPWFPVGLRLVRVNPATNRVDRLVKLANDFKFESFGAIIAFGSAWIGGDDGVTEPRVIRIPLEALRDKPSS
jgi:hypothetical protein